MYPFDDVAALRPHRDSIIRQLLDVDAILSLHGVTVEDPQFLIDAAGQLHMCDPMVAMVGADITEGASADDLAAVGCRMKLAADAVFAVRRFLV